MEGLKWRKASRSGANGGNCVEVARAANRVLSRDSKDPDGVILRFSPDAWRRLIAQIKEGRLDL
ncbi:DUF397 domain-containing protein [Actinomadura sp. HBU206391]|uniref:DUF397 domain-containing protein n=1 Tax=Actinomadura sp. HBU206391 TaxID=2731692 RepID=UPI00164F992B|nr:DUF397 domain-containing protein [Actinomadura sp. HBU206391]MBC6459100.1 DUF397 domain-containing protein [Actinomadura sp. HBU206391]